MQSACFCNSGSTLKPCLTTFTPPGEPWQVDLLDRETFSRSGDAALAAEGDPAPLKVVCCGRAIPDHELRVVDAAGIVRAKGLVNTRAVMDEIAREIPRFSAALGPPSESGIDLKSNLLA